MKLRIILLSLFLSLVCTIVFAQDYSHEVYNELDDATYKKISRRARQEVNLFTDYLSNIVIKSVKPNYRRDKMNDALKLFVGKGEVYYTYVLDVNGNPIDTIKHDPVKMQVTSLRDKAPRNLILKEYLCKLVEQANKKNSISVTIKTTKWQNMKASEIRKLEDGKYVLDVYFEQTYIRSTRERLIYADKTTKRVTCYIDIIETDLGTEFIVRLGDIEATDTQAYDA